MGDKTRNIAIILYLTRFAIIACLASAKRRGGWGKKRIRSHQSWPPFFSSSKSPTTPPPLMQQCCNITCTFFLAVLLQLKSCQSEAKENTGKSTKPSVQRCYPKIPMKFVFQHPAYNTQLTFPTEMKFNELQLYYR